LWGDGGRGSAGFDGQKALSQGGDRYYGNTKNGKFMTEADAIKAGYCEATTTAKPKQ
jgi:hypothetical protein